MTESALIIAEAEINHNGDVELAKQLVSSAAGVGADLIKFQCFVPEAFITPGSSYLSIFKKAYLSLQQFREIRERARDVGIRMLSTAGDLEGLAMILDLDLEGVKIGSTNITNVGLLRAIARSGKPAYLSTGASTFGEVANAVDILAEGCEQISLFHCTVQYPAAAENLNLLAIRTMIEAFPGLRVGYSDHSLGNTAAVAARALGATMFEKHFTLDRTLPGPDHNFSCDPPAMSSYIAAIREAEAMMGNGRKIPAACEEGPRLNGRRYLTAMRSLRAGHVLRADDIRPRRVEAGRYDVAQLLGPEWEERVIGRRLRCDVIDGDPVNLANLA